MTWRKTNAFSLTILKGVEMGTALAQLAIGFVGQKLMDKWGSKSISTPQVTARDITPTTQAEAPNAVQLGGEDTNYVRKNREALTIKRDNTNSYNPMNM